MDGVTLEVLILKSLSRLLNFLRNFLPGEREQKELVTHGTSLRNMKLEQLLRGVLKNSLRYLLPG